MKSNFDDYRGKCIDLETYEKEKRKYGLSESFITYSGGYPDSEITLERVGKEVVYQVADLGMGRARSITHSFDSEEEALAWMIHIMKRYMV